MQAKQKLYYVYRENKALELFEVIVTDAEHYDKTGELSELSGDIVDFLIEEDMYIAMDNYFVTDTNRHDLLTSMAALEQEENKILFFNGDLLDDAMPKLEVLYVVEELDENRLVTVVPKRYFEQEKGLNSEFNLLIEAVLEQYDVVSLTESIYESSETADEIRTALNASPHIKFIESQELLKFLQSFAEGGNINVSNIVS